jgi:hypothetical protein
LEIYLDTNIWNALCDQQVDPQTLVRTLALRNANLVIGLHVFYELIKTFKSAKNEALGRGRSLFSYLQGFMQTGIQCVKENQELLVAEMYGLKRETQRTEVFYKGADYVLIRQGIDKLAEGGFDERARQFIKEQDAFAANIRRDQL